MLVRLISKVAWASSPCLHIGWKPMPLRDYWRHCRSADATWRRNLSSLRHLPVPSATALSGSSATWTGKPVSSLKSLSKPRSNAPPPASTRPRSTRSAESSGGHRSRVIRTESTIVEIGSSSASRTSWEVIISVFGRPATRSRPLTSTLARLVHYCVAGWHCVNVTWSGLCSPIVCLGDEVAQHGFRDIEVRDDAIFERSHCDDVCQCAAEHAFGFVTDSQHSVGAGLHS